MRERRYIAAPLCLRWNIDAVMLGSLSRFPVFVAFVLFSACHSTEADTRTAYSVAPMAEVAPYDVEVLPYLPPGRLRSVGVFKLPSNSSFHWDDEQFLDEMKEKAASMGGNTVVSTDDSPNNIRVFYIPEDRGSHGGDEEN